MNDRPLTLLDARQALGPYATNFDSALNQAVERIHTQGTWPGLTKEVDLTDEIVDGILTLPDPYDIMLAVQLNGAPRNIFPLAVEYSHSGPGNREAGVGGGDFVDLGLQAIGDEDDGYEFRRQYKVLFDISGDDTVTGLLKRGFKYITQDDDYIYPGNIGALKNALLAINYEDEADNARAEAYWKACFDILNQTTSQIRNGTQTTATFRVFGLGASKPTCFF